MFHGQKSYVIASSGSEWLTEEDIQKFHQTIYDGIAKNLICLIKHYVD